MAFSPESVAALTSYAPYLGIAGLLVAYGIYAYLKKQPNGNEEMQSLELLIHDGAMAFLKKEYTYLAVFIVFVFELMLCFHRYNQLVKKFFDKLFLSSLQILR